MLFANRKCIFHNSKFDTNYMETELGFEFPDYEDTMLLHYCLEEAVGTHGLKPLALRFTDLGDYDANLTIIKNLGLVKTKLNWLILITECYQAIFLLLTHVKMPTLHFNCI